MFHRVLRIQYQRLYIEIQFTFFFVLYLEVDIYTVRAFQI